MEYNILEQDVNQQIFEYLRQILYTPEAAVLDRRELPVSMKPLADCLELLHKFVLEEHYFAEDLLQGRIDAARMPSQENVLAGSLKSVHSMLKHLVALMEQVAQGDYRQHVGFTDELSTAFNTMVSCLVELSLQDRLTGLLNVDGFDSKAAQLLQEPEAQTYFVVNINVNDFKHFNALYGPEKGDVLLRRVAAFLRNICQADELCSRIHADNFMCLVHGKDAESVAGRMDVDSASIWPETISSRTYLFRHGIYPVMDRRLSIRTMRDYASYAGLGVQHSSLCNYAVFDEALEHRYRLENTILEHFERAIKDREFEVYYQPKVETATGRVQSGEALVRWNFQRNGFMMPDAFIGLFETNGLITKLDFYVLDQVCQSLQEAKEQQLLIPVSVNFSQVHLLDVDFVQKLLGILQRYDLSPEWIEIEITETAFFENVDNMIQMIQSLHEAGFSVAMDDFGSGFSSLNFLRALPIDVMKIDKLFFKNFEDDENSRLLIMDILSMARHLGLKTVAEGIEKSGQAEFLRNHHCDMIQGYYYYKPLRKNEFKELLRQQRQ